MKSPLKAWLHFCPSLLLRLVDFRRTTLCQIADFRVFPLILPYHFAVIPGSRMSESARPVRLVAVSVFEQSRTNGAPALNSPNSFACSGSVGTGQIYVLRSRYADPYQRVSNTKSAGSRLPGCARGRQCRDILNWLPVGGRADQPPAQTLAELTRCIPERNWKKCSWVTAGAETRRTRLAWREVFLQHDLRHAEGELERVWLVVDWPAGDPEPYHYYLAHLHRPPTKTRCLRLSRSRWHIEQYFQRAKDDLGLDHFEGRSWRGFHHHLVLSAIAYLFILTMYLRRKKLLV